MYPHLANIIPTLFHIVRDAYVSAETSRQTSPGHSYVPVSLMLQFVIREDCTDCREKDDNWKWRFMTLAGELLERRQPTPGSCACISFQSPKCTHAMFLLHSAALTTHCWKIDPTTGNKMHRLTCFFPGIYGNYSTILGRTQEIMY